MSFADQVAIITGASSGIGWEVAKALAREKCHLGLVARRKEKLDALADECRALGVKAVVAPADVSDRAQVFQAVESIRSQVGPIDLLLANSGVGVPTLLEPMNLDEVDAMMRVNYCGVVYAMQAVLPEMLRRGRGHVAAISSLASYKALPGEGAYCSSKIAVNYYMESQRLQLKRRGIYATTICPGFIHTPMTEMNNFKMPWVMSAEKAAGYVLYALRKRKKVYNFPWQTMILMRITRWLPDFLIAHVLKDINVEKAKASREVKA